MSGFKKVFIIFTVAIVLATASNIFLGGANATDDSSAAVNESTQNTNTNVDTNSNVTTSTENTTVDNNTTSTDTNTNTSTNADTNTNTENNTADTNTNAVNNTNTNTATNTNTGKKNEVDWSQLRNTLPKTGSNYPLKNALLAIIFIAIAALGFVFMYNKKVGMTDETKR